MIGRLAMAPAGLRPERGDLGARLPYSHHVTPHIVALDSGALALAFEVAGVSFETSDADLIAQRVEQLNHTWRNLADERLALWQTIVRRQEPPPGDRPFASPYAEALDRRYREGLASCKLFASRLYLVLVQRPPGGPSVLFNKPTQADGAGQVQRLESLAGDLEQLLKPYGLRRLSLYERHGLVYSEFLELIGEVMIGAWAPAPLIAGRLSAAVTTARLIFGREVVEIRSAERSCFAALFSLKEYPAATPPGLWDQMLSLPFALNITQSFAFLSRPAAQGLLTRKQNQLVSAKDPAASQIEALDGALDDLVSNRFVMGEHHASVMVFGETPEVLSANLAHARARLAECGLVAGRDDLGLQASFWAQFPGQFADRLRPAPITSRNFAAFAPLHTHPNGPTRQLWWERPVTTLRSNAGAVFRFSFHVRDVGHTFICGPTGSGKTVVQNFLLSQAEALGVQRVLIDKDQGAEIFVRASGGQYARFEPGQPSGLSPLKSLPLTPANSAHLAQLIGLLCTDSGVPLTAALRREIEAAILAMEPLPCEARTFQALRTLLGQGSTSSLSARLLPWCAGEPLGWVFDESQAELDLTPRLLGLDVTTLLEAPQVRAPLLFEILFRLQGQASGQRLIIAFDEFWKALGDEAFRTFAQDGLKTFRKQNALLMLTTQSPADVLRSPIAHTLVEQCATKIFLPNPAAQPRDYVDGFGLSHRELSLVREGIAPGSGQFLLKQEGAAVIARLDLSALDDDLAILSGRAETIALMNTLRSRRGETPQAWLPEFQQSWRDLQ